MLPWDRHEKEKPFGEVIGYVTGLAVLIASLGIFGMSIFISQQRVKEVGIRKVLGASVSEVYLLVTRECLGLVLVSAVVAFPITAYLVSQWLNQFAYHVSIGFTDIVLAVTIDVVIVLATITYHMLRVVRANPVVSLRYE